MQLIDFDAIKLAVVGLGYVGLPLAVEFGKHRKVIGFDINLKRVDELRSGQDSTQEVEDEELASAHYLNFTTNVEDIADCNVYIVTVPTPVDAYKKPDLSPLLRASETIGQVLKPGNIVIYESTVYPGATEEECLPLIERTSGLKYNVEFFAGYSPERINPGDKRHRLTQIMKVTSGSTPEVADLVDRLYSSIIMAGTYKAASIRVAEAAKVIENTQRDVNIALINEFAMIFHRLGIDTMDVLKAAETKWNFLNFRPGLVGGHCIGVDPYYLAHKAVSVGYHPEMILAGRRINDCMGEYLANRLVRQMMTAGHSVVGSRILVLGLTFKENCPDLRNSQVARFVNEMVSFNAHVHVHDPFADPAEAMREYNVALANPEMERGHYDAVVLAVPHQPYVEMGPDTLRSYGTDNSIFFDVKAVFSQKESDGRL